MSVSLRFAAGFTKQLKRLPPNRQDQAVKALELFMEEPKLHRFKFRVLKGHSAHFIINASRGDRIILRRIEHDSYEVVAVGKHDIYREWDR